MPTGSEKDQKSELRAASETAPRLFGATASNWNGWAKRPMQWPMEQAYDACLCSKNFTTRIISSPSRVLANYLKYSEFFFNSSGIFGNGGNSWENPLNKGVVVSARLLPS